MLTLLRQRNFALVWFGGLISLTGDWVLIAGLPFFVYQLTGSTAATAAAVAARVIPRLTLGSVAGIFVDRWSRRRTMLITNLLLGCVLLPLLAVRSIDWLWVVYTVTACQSVLVQFLSPAESAFLPFLVTNDELVPANALNGLNDNLARLLGPPIGGAVVALWGITGVALLDTASFFVATILIALVTVEGRAPRVVANGLTAGPFAAVWSEGLAGLALVRNSRVLKVIFLFLALTGIGEGVMSSLFAPFVATILGGDGLAYGEIMAAQAVGGLLGSAIIGRIGQKLPTARLFGLGALGLGAIDLLTFNAHRMIPGIGPPLLFMAVVGIPAAGVVVGLTTLLQQSASNAFLGRVFGAVGMLGGLSGLIGAAIGGALGGPLGIVSIINLQGYVYIAGGLLVLNWLASPGRQSKDAVPDAEL